jgi:hypothetical protein
MTVSHPSFLALLGIFSILFLVSALSYVGSTAKGFEFRKYTVSHLVFFPKAKNFFTAVMLIYSFLRLIYFPYLITTLSLWNNYMIVFSFIITFGSFVVATLIPLTLNRTIHNISALISGFFTILFILSLGMTFLKTSTFLGISNILIANSLLWGSLFVFFTKGTNCYFQLYYAASVIIWDSLMALFLFGVIR